MVLRFLNIGFCHQVSAGMSASLGGFSYTVVFGWVTPILPRLISVRSEIPMTPSEASWMTSLPQLTSFLSPIPAAMLADHIGRKPVILLSTPFFAVGWLIILCLRTYSALLVARFLQGLGVGIVLSVVPVYLGEIASTEYRGAITSLFFILTWVGYLFEYSTGPFLSFANFTLITLVTCLLFFVVFSLQPETPYFYLMQGNKPSALRSLKWFRSSSDDLVRKELDIMESSVDEDKRKGNSWKEVVATTTDRKALWILLFVGILRGTCGVIPFVAYATSHFKLNSGFEIPSKYITITLGLILLLSSLVSFLIMDVFGRRPLLISTFLLSSICSLTSSAFYFLDSNTEVDVSFFNLVPSVLVIMFPALLVIGVYPVMSAYTSELFNSKTRSTAASINITLSSICAFIEFKLYQDFIDMFGVYFNFLLFGVICLVGAVVSYLYMPETKNKTFKEIRMDLEL